MIFKIIILWTVCACVVAPIIGLALGAFKHPRVCARIVEVNREKIAA